MSLFTTASDKAQITAFYAISLKEFSMPVHQHPACEIMLITKGRCQIQVDGEFFELQANEFVFLDENVPHQLLIKEREPCHLLNLEFLMGEGTKTFNIGRVKETSASYQELFQNLNSIPVKAKDSRSLTSSLQALLQLLTTQPPGQGWSEEMNYSVELLFNRVLLELCHCLKNDGSRKGSQYLNQALTYIRQHLAEELRVTAIAQHIGINKSYLHLLFSQQLGLTIIEYINRERIKLSCYLLTNSDLPLVEIAVQCGFNSRQHFAGTFRKFLKQTPREYRKLHQESKQIKNSGGQYRLEQTWHHIHMGPTLK